MLYRPYSLFLSLFFICIFPNEVSTRCSGPLSTTLATQAPLQLRCGKLPKHTIQIRAFLQQYDRWSCGYRVLFHALACERALQHPKHFNKQLKKELCCRKTLTAVYNQLKMPEELSNFDIEEIAQCLGLADRLVIIEQDRKSVQLLGDIAIDLPSPLKAHEKKEYIHTIRKKRLHDDLNNLTAKVIKDHKAAYVVCGAYEHWTLFAFIPLGSQVKLYMIDSCNNALAPCYQPTLAFLTPFLTVSNSKLAQKKSLIRKQAICGTLKAAIPHFKTPQASTIPFFITCVYSILVILFIVITAGKRYLKTAR